MKKKIYMAVLLLSIIATGVLLYGRINVESQSKRVEVLADYEEFAIMASQQGLSEIELFKMLGEAGISGVALKEESLYSMVDEMKPLEYDLFKNITTDLDWKDKYGSEAVAFLEDQATRPYNIVIRTKDQDLFDFLTSGIAARYDEAFYNFFDESVKTIVLQGSIEDIYYTESAKYTDYLAKGVKLPRQLVSSSIEDIGLGFDPEKVQQIKDAGLSVNLRPNNFYKYNSKLVEAYFADVERFGETPNVLIFNGSEIMSYNAEKGTYDLKLYDVLKKSGMPIGMVEAADQLGFIEQKGVDVLAKDLEYNIIRVFPMIEYIQQRYNYLGYYDGGKEIENTMYRAITERNIRVIYFRPYKDSKFTYFTDLDEYKETFSGLEKRLEAHNITLGKPSVIPYNHMSIYMLMLSSLGLLVLGLIILKLVFDIAEKFEWVLFGVGTVGVLGINYVAPNISIDLFAFIAANIFPTLAIIFVIEFVKDILLSNKVYTLKGILIKSTIGLTIAVMICMIGGFYVGATMSRADYLIEMSFYRGVKASLLLPMMFFVVIYLIKLGYKRNTRELDGNTFFVDDIKRFFYEDVKMYYALIAALLAGVLYVYLARSGHETNIEVLNIELIFRNFLEDNLLARPRTKEIFIAFPALSAAIYFAARGYNKMIFPFLFASVIGLTSIVNTYCHSRAPIYLSFSRTMISLAFSIVIGIVVVLILDFLNKIYVSHFGSKKYE